jgi:hypothetical protein
MAEPTSDQLAQSVLPLFVPNDSDPEAPARAGSCVLVRLFNRHFVVTARHVFGDLARRMYFVGRNGSKLIPFAVPGVYTIGPPENLDAALVPLSGSQFDGLKGFRFISEQWIELEAGHYSAQRDEFVVFGFPDSNSQFRPNRPLRNIRQNSFYFRTTAARPAIAQRENIDSNTHFLVEFDPRQITVKGARHNPPNPRGLSGGAAFHVINGTMKLAGILTEHRKSSGVMVCVRTSEIAAIAQHVVLVESQLTEARPSRAHQPGRA